ncbi:hypothetical protein AB0M29_28555 [Streptomyces sp. NPDC051976]|uniref:hypothetical protein n=1 Tax=Streptomyces sp. NPDC051976 TaxID=3154947 RepID=UPI0034248475
MVLIVVILLVRLGVLMVTCTRAVAATARARRRDRARAVGAGGGTGGGQAEVSERQLVADRLAGILGQRPYQEAMEALAGAEESLGALWVPQLRDE